METDTSSQETLTTSDICFGLNRKTDEESLQLFIKKFANTALLAKLVPKMKDQDITDLLDLITKIMKNNLSDSEYHQFFLNNQ
jgi:hypothetical protein